MSTDLLTDTVVHNMLVTELRQSARLACIELSNLIQQVKARPTGSVCRAYHRLTQALEAYALARPSSPLPAGETGAKFKVGDKVRQTKASRLTIRDEEMVVRDAKQYNGNPLWVYGCKHPDHEEVLAFGEKALELSPPAGESPSPDDHVAPPPHHPWCGTDGVRCDHCESIKPPTGSQQPQSERPWDDEPESTREERLDALQVQAGIEPGTLCFHDGCNNRATEWRGQYPICGFKHEPAPPESSPATCPECERLRRQIEAMLDDGDECVSEEWYDLLRRKQFLEKLLAAYRSGDLEAIKALEDQDHAEANDRRHPGVVCDGLAGGSDGGPGDATTVSAGVSAPAQATVPASVGVSAGQSEGVAAALPEGEGLDRFENPKFMQDVMTVYSDSPRGISECLRDARAGHVELLAYARQQQADLKHVTEQLAEALRLHAEHQRFAFQAGEQLAEARALAQSRGEELTKRIASEAEAHRRRHALEHDLREEYSAALIEARATAERLRGELAAIERLKGELAAKDKLLADQTACLKEEQDDHEKTRAQLAEARKRDAEWAAIFGEPFLEHWRDWDADDKVAYFQIRANVDRAKLKAGQPAPAEPTVETCVPPAGSGDDPEYWVCKVIAECVATGAADRVKLTEFKKILLKHAPQPETARDEYGMTLEDWRECAFVVASDWAANLSFDRTSGKWRCQDLSDGKLSKPAVYVFDSPAAALASWYRARRTEGGEHGT